MTAADRLARAIELAMRVTRLSREVEALEDFALAELADAKGEAMQRVDEMPTNVQPAPSQVQ